MKLFPISPAIGFLMVACGTALGIAGTDLVLPAVPLLPSLIGGTPAEAQLVLAAFVAGTGLGLLLFGELGARMDPRMAIVLSLTGYALACLIAGFVSTLDQLIALRFLQGAASAAPAVFAPGFIRALYPEGRAVRMFGRLGSVESLVPALAPIPGAWLLVNFGWRSSFLALGALSFALAGVLFAASPGLPRIVASKTDGSYLALMRRLPYLRYALSHAFSLGGLLAFIFSAPAIIVDTMGGHLSDFILLQICGIAFFILGANLTGGLTEKWGHEAMILFGSALSALGAISILSYGVVGGSRPLLLIPLSAVLNLGFGLRGPPGFLQAVLAAGGDDARGSALAILAILLTSAAGAAMAAPFVASGLSGPACVSAGLSVGSVICLLVFPAAKGAAN